MDTQKNGHPEAQLVTQLAQETQGVPSDAPCCAWCAGVKLVCDRPPATPKEVLKSREGCPISIVAYSVAREHMKGRNVTVAPRPNGGTPIVTVNGKIMDPLKHYNVEQCGCPQGKAASS